MNSIIHSMLAHYDTGSVLTLKNAYKEVIQRVILCGLARGGFFEFASFYGGTSLRVFRGLDRFSEDLDFTLTEERKDVDLSRYLEYVSRELETYGIPVSIHLRQKQQATSVLSAYTKTNFYDLVENEVFRMRIPKSENISVKIDLETTIFPGATEEFKTIVSPSFAKVRTFDLPTLFASKLLAVIGRGWKNRVKGRDYYDYLFYISNGVPINMIFLKNGLTTFRRIEEDALFSLETLKELLREKFLSVDFQAAREDVLPFVDHSHFLDAFDQETFLSTLEYLQESR